jgi:hypothetical protein
VRSLLAAALCASTLACTAAHTKAAPRKEKPYLLATLTRSGCFGSCPAYLLQIHSNGRVFWFGIAEVETMGEDWATLDAATLQAVRDAFDEANFFDLGEGYDCHEETDSTFVTTFYSDGVRKKLLQHYHGCLHTPDPAKLAALGALERRLDALVDTARWIGKPAGR